MTVVPRYAIVFNPGESHVEVDDGKTCEPQGWAPGRLDLIQHMITSGRLVELDPDTITEKSNPDVILVKEQVSELNKAAKKEQRKVDKETENK